MANPTLEPEDLDEDSLSIMAPFDPSSVSMPGMPGVEGPNYSPYLTMMGGGLTAMSQISAGNKSAQYLRTNAAIAGQQAQGEAQAGAQQEELYRQHLDQVMGKQIAEVGGSGVTMSGSPLRSIQNTALLGNQDMAQIQLNAARKAWGFQVSEAGDLQRAAQAKSAGFSSGLGTLITSTARAYGSWSTDDD